MTSHQRKDDINRHVNMDRGNLGGVDLLKMIILLKTGMQGPWPGLSISLVNTCSELSVVNCRSATQL